MSEDRLWNIDGRRRIVPFGELSTIWTDGRIPNPLFTTSLASERLYAGLWALPQAAGWDHRTARPSLTYYAHYGGEIVNHQIAEGPDSLPDLEDHVWIWMRDVEAAYDLFT